MENEFAPKAAAEPDLAHLLASAGISLFVFDDTGAFRSMTGSLMQVLGYREFPKDERPINFLHPDDRSIIGETMVRLRATGMTICRAARAVHLDGSIVPVELVFTSALSDPDLNGYLVTARPMHSPESVRGAADHTIDRSLPERIRRGRDALRAMTEQTSGALDELDLVLSRILEVTESGGMTLGIVRRTGEWLHVIAAKEGQGGRVSVDISPHLSLAAGAPLRDALTGSEPVFFDDLDLIRRDGPDAAMAVEQLFRSSRTGFVIPCTWGQRRGIVTLHTCPTVRSPCDSSPKSGRRPARRSKAFSR